MRKQPYLLISIVLMMFLVCNALGGNIASNPVPSDRQKSVAPDIKLNWTPGDLAASHDVYFGTNFDDVNDANNTLWEGVSAYKGNFDVNSYDPCGLGICRAYYWRVDEVNGPNVWRGEVWRFTTCDADFNWDNIVNFDDYGQLALCWLLSYPKDQWEDALCESKDIYPSGGDGEVDIGDLAVFANLWLSGSEPEKLWDECWECPTQCHGNADCGGGLWQVNLGDVLILKQAFDTSYGDSRYDACADFTRDGNIDDDDTTELKEWYNRMGVPADCPTSP